MIHFIVNLQPVPKGRPRFNGKFAYTPDATRKFERDMARAAAEHRPVKPLEGPLAITLMFFIQKPKSVKREFPCVRPDIDNFQKSAIDALKGFWKDDGQICEVRAVKRYSDQPMIFVKIAPIIEGAA